LSANGSTLFANGESRSLDRLRMWFLGLGFEALKLDFLDDGRDIGLRTDKQANEVVRE
jgi:hypothetical protein